ncbi:MAG: hypothetical protein RL026_2642 [Pseudomonadota bacterium]|jgi:hypothetical protein
MSPTLDLVQSAALCLTQPGTLKDRLAIAYQNYLCRLTPEILPAPFRSGFAELCAAMHSVPPLPRENPVLASVRKMSQADASRHAGLVVRLLGAVAAQQGDGASAQAAVPPAVAMRVPVVALRLVGEG